MRILIFLVLVIPGYVLGQNSTKFEIETRSGYEYNIFRDYPNNTGNDDQEDPGIKSGFFQYSKFQFDWKKKVELHQFGIKAGAEFDYFPTVNNANRFKPAISLNYTAKTGKYTSLIAKSKFSIYRTRKGAAEEVIGGIPSPYRKLDLSLGYKFRPIKYNKTLIEASYINKTYDPFNERQYKYNSLEMKVRSTQRFKKKDKSSSYLTMEYEFQRRQSKNSFTGYPDEAFFDEPEFDEFEEEEGEEGEFEEDEEAVSEEDFFDSEDLFREGLWLYHNLKLEYTFRTSSTLKWKTGLVLSQRTDKQEELYGYRQIRPFVELAFKDKKIELKWKTSAVFRQYTDLTADQNDNILLRQTYLRSSIRAAYQVKEPFFLTFKAALVNRSRNMPSGRNSRFLPYTNGEVSVGVRVVF
ncbi:MAG: hypothetical protein AAF502_09085 [Bacteroidota bacterium]